MLYSFIVVIAVVVLSGVPLNFGALLCLPIIMLVEYILALGLALIVSAFTVFFRDLEYMLGILMMVWQFLTPVMYSINIITSEGLRSIFMLNPMTPIIIAYRDVLYYAKLPDLSTLAMGALMGAAVLVLGFLIFGRLKKRFAEEL